MKRILPVALAAALIASCNPGARPVATVDGDAITVSQLADKLPQGLDTMAQADSVRRVMLNRLIDRKVMAHEAISRGAEKDIQTQLELDQKFLVTQRLFDAVTENVAKPTDADLRAAHEQLQTEVHVMLLSTRSESVARQAATELDQGAPFETLAARYSAGRSAANGGDMGFVPLFYLDGPIRSEVAKLQPGQHTAPVQSGDAWHLVQLVERRPASPPPPSLDDKQFREQLSNRLQQQERRAVATKYLADMRARLKYNEPGVQLLMTKPIDSMTDADKDVPVAIKDGKQYVKVLRLLKVARDWPAQVDTGIKRYAIQQEIEGDLMYEDALNRGLQKLPKVAKELADRHEDLLYQQVYNQEIAPKATVSDSEARAYYDAHRQRYVDPDFEKVKGMIQDQLTRDRIRSLQEQYIAGLRAKAKITIDEKLLKTVRPVTTKPQDKRAH